MVIDVLKLYRPPIHKHKRTTNPPLGTSHNNKTKISWKLWIERRIESHAIQILCIHHKKYIIGFTQWTNTIANTLYIHTMFTQVPSPTPLNTLVNHNIKWSNLIYPSPLSTNHPNPSYPTNYIPWKMFPPHIPAIKLLLHKLLIQTTKRYNSRALEMWKK